VAAEVAELDPSREIVLHQRPGRLRDHDLAAVCRGTDPRGPVDVHPDVVATDETRLSRVRPDADSYLAAIRPARSRQASLAFGDRGNGGWRITEDHEERVALGPHLETVVPAERTAQDSPMDAEDVGPSRPELVDESRRALNVGEDEGERSRGKTSRAGRHGDRS
jgi:hypothetical protein